MKFTNGLHKAPVDKRDILMRSFLKYEGLPMTYDITEKMTPVRSQGKEGSCAGFAGDGVKEYQEQIDSGHYKLLSPRYIYELAKKISGHSEGTTLKAICQVLRDKGICFEKDWPYVAGDVGSPSPKADDNAAKHKIKSYARITTIEELKQTIHQKYPEGGATLIGVKVYKGMVSEQCQANGVVPDPTCWDSLNVLGGHAVVAVAWNDSSPYYKNDGHIKIKNSWGTNWGNEGYGYLSYKYIKNNMLDAMAMIDVEMPDKVLRVKDISPVERDIVWI